MNYGIERIFLQDYAEVGEYDEMLAWRYRINEGVTEYIRADIVAEQLAEREKQIVMLRDALYLTKKQAIDGRIFTSMAAFTYWPNAVVKALTITQDLSGCILCDAEPVAWMRDAGEPSLSTMAYCIPTSVKDVWLKVNPKNVERYVIPFYKARKPIG
jgi:hypothetical protein